MFAVYNLSLALHNKTKCFIIFEAPALSLESVSKKKKEGIHQ